MVVWLVLFVTAMLLRVYLRFNIAKCTPDTPNQMAGKVVIVTGANTGIGYHTVKVLAERGAKVILACRNESRGTRARDQIIQETGNGNVVYKQLDLASLTSVRKFCEDVTMAEKKVDVLVNNAGVICNGDQYTEDGIIEVMQVNLFAPMLLTDLLLPLLKRADSGRIVNVSSITHYFGRFNIQKVNKSGQYGDIRKYANSKFGNIVFTVELARRLRGTGVSVSACHPGIVHTSLVRRKNILDMLFAVLCWICKRSAAEAAATQVHLSACPGVTSGAFYVDCAVWPTLHGHDRTTARDLWAAAEALMKCTLGNMAYAAS